MREGWKETTLGEVAKCAGGSSFPIEHQNGRTGIPFIKVSDLNTPGNDREITAALNYITSELAAELGVRVWPMDTVIFPKVGAALLTDKRRILTQDTIFDNNLLGLVGNHEIYPRFLLLFMETIRMSDFAQMGALPSVSHRIIEKLRILIPPLTEQRRIVDVIGAVDAYVASLEGYAHAARTARAALLHELLTTNTEGWKETTLGEVAEVVGGGTPSTTRAEFWDGEIVWLTPTEVVALDGGRVSDSERKITKQGLAGSGARLLPAGTVILTSRASVGFVAIADCELCTNQGFQSLIPRPQILAEFLLPWIQTNRSEFMARSAGSTFKEISKTNVATMKIQLPPLAEQERIVDVIESVDGAIASADRAAEDARSLRAGLLSDLLSGDHEIPAGYDELLGAA